jgi:hypothetical protein
LLLEFTNNDGDCCCCGCCDEIDNERTGANGDNTLLFVNAETRVTIANSRKRLDKENIFLVL